MERSLADDAVLRQHATVLRVLAEEHGLTGLALGDGQAEIIATVAAGRTYFDVARFGSALKHYALRTGISQGRGPLAPAIQFRDKLAHQPLDRLAPEVVWETSVRDAPELIRIIEALINDLPQ